MLVTCDLVYQRAGYLVGDTLKRFIQTKGLLRTEMTLCSQGSERCSAGLVPDSTFSAPVKRAPDPDQLNRRLPAASRVRQESSAASKMASVRNVEERSGGGSAFPLAVCLLRCATRCGQFVVA